MPASMPPSTRKQGVQPALPLRRVYDLEAGHTDAVRQVAEAPANMTTALDVADLRTEITAMEGHIYRAMLIQTGAIVGAVVIIMRLIGE